MTRTSCLSFFNWIDNPLTSLSATSEADGLGVGNLVNFSPQIVWRSLNFPGPRAVAFDLGTPRYVGVISICQPRNGYVLGAGATIEFKLSNVSAGGSELLSATVNIVDGVMGSFGYYTYVLPDNVIARYGSVAITYDAQPYTQIGRLWAGQSFIPEKDIVSGWTNTWQDDSKIQKIPRSGIRLRDFGPRYRTLNFQYDALSPAERSIVEQGDMWVGSNRQMLVCIDPDDPLRDTIMGTVQTVSPISQPYFNVHTKAYQVEEDV